MGDTAGHDWIKTMTETYCTGCPGIILVYYMTDTKCFLNLTQYWLLKISKKANFDIELVIVINKTDLINERKVHEEEIKYLMKTD